MSHKRSCYVQLMQPYRTAPRPGQLSSSTYMSDAACRWVSSLKSCLRHIVELIIGSRSESSSTNLSTSSCWVPRTRRGKEVYSGRLNAFKCLKVCKNQEKKVMLLCVNVTCSSQQGTEANACTLVLELHHINPASRNRLDQPFTELNTRAIQKRNREKKRQ